MNVLVTGASGLIGSAFVAEISERHHVIRAVRRAPRGAGEAGWDPSRGEVSGGPWQAVVHLAGRSIATRWTAGAKREIARSRVDATHALCSFLGRSPSPPRAMIAASAVGFYGDQGDRWLDERSPRGRGFLAEVVENWERACDPARASGIRVVSLRFAPVLARSGGALAAMLPLFRLGLGGPLGGGRQFWSWIALPDAIAAIERAMVDETLQGPLNVTSPNPLRQKAFALAMGRALGRPARLPAPRFALELALGEMAGTLLDSARMHPAKLAGAGFRWQWPDLEPALFAILSSSDRANRHLGLD